VYVMAGDRDRARAVFVRADSAHAHYTVNRALLHAVLENWTTPSRGSTGSTNGRCRHS